MLLDCLEKIDGFELGMCEVILSLCWTQVIVCGAINFTTLFMYGL